MTENEDGTQKHAMRQINGKVHNKWMNGELTLL